MVRRKEGIVALLVDRLISVSSGPLRERAMLTRIRGARGGELCNPAPTCPTKPMMPRPFREAQHALQVCAGPGTQRTKTYLSIASIVFQGQGRIIM